MQTLPTLLVVGAFPPESSKVRGGQVTACGAVMQPPFTSRFMVRVIDTTQRSNPPPPLPTRAFFAARRICTFLRQLLVHRPHGVLLFADVGMSFVEKGCMSVLARFTRTPSVLFLRGGELIEVFERSWVQRRLMKALLTRADRFLCQGPTWQAFAVNKLGYPTDRAPIIPNWTATEDLLRIGRARTPKIEPAIPRVVFVGWLEREKGIEELLTAVKTLRADGLSFTVSLIGDGKGRPWIESFVQDHAIRDCVHLAGWQTPEQIRAHLAAHDIFALPSWAEGMPNSLIEAMSAGLACICTRVGVVSDFVVDREHALLIAHQSPQELVAAIRTLVQDSELRHKLGCCACALAEHVFSERRGVERFAALVETAVCRPAISR
jgi:glycosyltransferase involved in cell wall biosynthesis